MGYTDDFTQPPPADIVDAILPVGSKPAFDFPTIPLCLPGEEPRRGEGFLYLVTRTGKTGGGKLDYAAIARRAAAARSVVAPLPVCLGFGISTPEDVRALAPAADGLVVGSALVAAFAAGGRAALTAKISALRAAAII